MKKSKFASLTVLTVLMVVLVGGDVAFGFAGGDGLEGSPWQISTKADLEAVNDDLSAHYILVNDIDPTGIDTYTDAVIAPYINSSSPKFTGSFDGNDYVIRNLTIEGFSYCGLFGMCGSGSEVKNLYMENTSINGSLFVGCLVGYNQGDMTNCYVIGDISGPSYVFTDVDEVGGLVGYNSYGNITNCSSSGTITCPLRSMYNNNEYVGGLVGYNHYGTVVNCSSSMNITTSAFGGDQVGGLVGFNNYGDIISSYATGNISGDNFIGGLVGQNVSGNITQCFSTGQVTGEAETHGGINYADYIGGLVGINTGNISSCYSAGAVTGDHYLGGLVGENWNGGQITNSYSTGDVGHFFYGSYNYIGGLVGSNRSQGSAISHCYTISYTSSGYPLSSYVGSLVGYNEDSTITCSFWDRNLSGIILGYATSSPDLVTDVFGKTTAEMQTQSTFTDYGWDFLGEDINGTEDIWEMIDYPKLDWENDLVGEGTSESPYLIKDFEGFLDFCRKDKYWKRWVYTRLDCDLDLNPNLPGRTIYTTAVIAPDTDPATSNFQGTSFIGIFDGNGHVISNLTIDTAGADNDYLGLFGWIYDFDAKVKNLGIENCMIIGGNDSDSVGGLCGYNKRSTIDNCYVTGMISGNSYVGGLCGRISTEAFSDGGITNCYAFGMVSGNYSVGGLVGFNAYSSIASCYATAAVSGDSSVGGLVGDNYGGTVSSIVNCYSTGKVFGYDYVGGLCGKNGGIINNCYAAGQVKATGYNVGGLSGDNSGIVTGSFWDKDTLGQLISAGGEPRTTAQMMDSGTFIGWNDGRWTINSGNGYPHLTWENTPGQSITTEYPTSTYTGSGTQTDPYVLSTPADLVCMSKRVPDWDKYFTMSNDIDMSGVVYIPVVKFSGHFNGAGFVISNLTIDSQAIGNRIYLGLFGQIGYGVGVEVKNLGLENCNIIGGDNSENLGGFAGKNRGIISNCYSVGTITGGNNSKNLGGLIGDNSSGTISNCYATVTITAAGYGDSNLGGLIGSNSHGNINNCYVTGTVSGSSYVGGLCGDNHGEIRNCYSTGTVTGDYNLGGLLGRSDGSNIANCFWDIETSGITTSAGGVGKTTAEMKTESTFTSAGWDFVGETANGTHEIWEMPAEDAYPALAILNSYVPPVLSGDGTADYPYLIGSPAELGAIIHYDLTSFYQLTNDIDLSGIQWSLAVVADFSGHFNGAGHVISNLTINSNTNYIGLFGQITDSDAEVKNLGLDNCIITSGSDSDYVGGLVGKNNYGTINDCHATGTVTGGDNSLYLGGLFGYNSYGIISDCYATVVVIGGVNSRYLGGLAGMNNYGSISNSYATGAVTGDRYVGGLVGSKSNPNSIISDSYATGSVNGTEFVGGLCGNSFNGNITHCYATGSVSGDKSAGGLVGQNYGQTTSDCYATGAVTGGDDSASLGGLCGSNDSDINNCYATGAVTGGDNSSTLGGLCGYSSQFADITNCYAAGAVSSGIDSTYLGGLMGRSGASPYGGYDISGCFWNTQTSGLEVAYTHQFVNDFTPVYSTVGIVEGRTTAEMQTQSTFTDAGWDFVSNDGDPASWWINEHRDYPKLAWQPFGDVNNDSHVNLSDLAAILAAWGASSGQNDYHSVCDLSGDAVIGVADLTILADRWLDGPTP